ncbi:MAG: hypothetical protein KBG20_21200 [Caldilineaceae bacterium]|nr:hypothetical protein [Caldilineaceae bacterium]MBP8106339.1 hypothetical protein [Caldilineaceae bacterium]MBP8125056.1 hypothetical protein [Caldilineaceae bacterium]MBP9074838.1 hypothetical protein [Caldilineaceae bacterium]
MSEKMTIVIRKRSWIEWTSWAVWLIGALLIIQNAIGSAQELEPRSALILWVSLAVWLLAGLVVWFVRRDR